MIRSKVQAMSTYNSPIAVDPVTFATDPATGNDTASATTAPVSFGGALYMVLSSAAANNWDVWKSVDSGSTWAKVNAGAGPNFQYGHSSYNPTLQKFTVAFFDITSITPTISLQSFDLATETWGAVIPGGPQTPKVALVALRSDGSVIVVYQNNGVGRIYLVTTYNGAWGAIQNLDQNFAGGMTQYAEPKGCLDPATDTLHVTWGAVYNGVNTYGFYQAIDSANVLQAFNQFANTNTAAFPEKANIIGRPAIFGAYVVIPYTYFSDPNNFTTARAAAFLGTPTAAPVWSSVFIDAGYMFDNTLNPSEPPNAVTDGTTVYVHYPCQTIDGTYPTGRIRECTSTVVSTWESATVFDIEKALDFVTGAGTQTITAPLLGIGVGLAITAFDPTHTNRQRFFMLLVPITGFVSPFIEGAGLPVNILPGMGTLDASGANTRCFPLRLKGACYGVYQR